MITIVVKNVNKIIYSDVTKNNIKISGLASLFKSQREGGKILDVTKPFQTERPKKDKNISEVAKPFQK